MNRRAAIFSEFYIYFMKIARFYISYLKQFLIYSIAMRLVTWDGYDHPRQGTIHIFKDGSWGTLCGPVTTKETMKVLCKMMGYEYEILKFLKFYRRICNNIDTHLVDIPFFLFKVIIYPNYLCFSFIHTSW